MGIRYLTAGESHGRGLTGILEGIPAGIEITRDYLHAHLLRRKQGHGRGARQKIETDEIEILSGIRHGKTLGSPISFLMWNKDWSAWQNIMQAEPTSDAVRKGVLVPRPGHADLIGGIKYKHKDMRNVLERSSARETAMRVALGTVARKFLENLGISIASRVVSIGEVRDTVKHSFSITELNLLSNASPTRCLDKNTEEAMIREIDAAKKAGDTLGGVFEVYASGSPVGLGSYSQWDRRLESRIGEAFLGLNAIKGVEIGLGAQTADRPGSVVHDEYFPGESRGTVSWKTNFSGGIDGGMTTGQPIVIRAAMKPLSTLMKPLRSVNLQTGESTLAHIERSDVCAVPSAAVIGESLLALVLTEAILEKFGGDSLEEISERVRNWKGTF